MQALHLLMKSIGYTFKSEKNLQMALKHRSAGRNNNERLEFLGDALLNGIIASALFERFPRALEGDMSRMRALLVCKESLAEIARSFSLGDYLQLGEGEMRSGGFRRDSILADGLEALIGAIYLDASFEVCRDVVLKWFHAKLTMKDIKNTNKDAKTRLQEYLQAARKPLPTYTVKSIIGKVHDQIFVIECSVEGMEGVASGQASSRRQAEQEAAEKFLKGILSHDE